MSIEYINCSTANAQKMSFFAAKSKEWWNNAGATKLLIPLNNLKVPLIQEALVKAKLVKEEFASTPKPLEGLKILDAGCGGGYLSEPLAELGCHVVGIDICLDIIQVAKQHAALNPALTNLTYLYESIEEHSKHNNEEYDAIIVSEVIDHVDEQDLFLKEVVKCLKPGGLIFISTFNKTWTCWLCMVVLCEYVLKVIPHGTHWWDKLLTPEDLRRKLQILDCETKKVRGMVYNFFTGKWCESENIFMNYSLYAIKKQK